MQESDQPAAWKDRRDFKQKPPAAAEKKLESKDSDKEKGDVKREASGAAPTATSSDTAAAADKPKDSAIADADKVKADPDTLRDKGQDEFEMGAESISALAEAFGALI